jgi:hypothetical protein
MIRKIIGHQEDIVVLVDGHFTGTGFQRYFLVSKGTGAAGQKEKNQNEQ